MKQYDLLNHNQSENLKELISKGESYTLQFKREFIGQDRIANEMVAFANNKGDTIVIGVDDKTGDIIGLDYKDIQSFVNNEETETFKAILYRNVDQSAESDQKSCMKTNEGSQKTQGGCQKNESLILRCIKHNPKISRKMFSETIGISPSAIQKHIENLKVKGIIKRVGPDKGGYWQVNPNK